MYLVLFIRLIIFGYLLFKFISACIFVLCLLVGDDPYFWTDDRQSVFPPWRWRRGGKVIY